jgi:hypothetical protein
MPVLPLVASRMMVSGLIWRGRCGEKERWGERDGVEMGRKRDGEEEKRRREVFFFFFPVGKTHQASLLSSVNHRDANAILDRVRRVEKLELRHDLRRRAVSDAPQPHQRRVADQRRHVVGDARFVGRARGCCAHFGRVEDSQSWSFEFRLVLFYAD